MCIEHWTRTATRDCRRPTKRKWYYSISPCWFTFGTFSSRTAVRRVWDVSACARVRAPESPNIVHSHTSGGWHTHFSFSFFISFVSFHCGKMDFYLLFIFRLYAVPATCQQHIFPNCFLVLSGAFFTSRVHCALIKQKTRPKYHRYRLLPSPLPSLLMSNKQRI